jgi:hypothetical protein
MLDDLLADGMNSDLGQMMYEKYTEGMNASEATEWANKLVTNIGVAKEWGETDWGTAIKNIERLITDLPQHTDQEVQSDGNRRAINSMATSLQTAGFNVGVAGVTQTNDGYTTSVGNEAKAIKQLNNMQAALSEDEGLAETDFWKEINANGNAAANIAKAGLISDQTTYYNTGSATIAAKGAEKSYTDYLYHHADQIREAALQDKVVGIPIEYYNDTEFNDKSFSMRIAGTDNDSLSKSGSIDNADLKSALTNGMKNQSNKHLALYNGTLYIRKTTAGNDWRYLLEHNGSEWVHAVTNVSRAKTWAKAHSTVQYATGGLADFTGPAWLDGTKSHPEYVLNAAQTERFFSLVDVLEGFDKRETSEKSSGDNYFDININVDKLEDDYDVEKLADKIRRMIYEDSMYRNVNSVNLIR